MDHVVLGEKVGPLVLVHPVHSPGLESPCSVVPVLERGPLSVELGGSVLALVGIGCVIHLLVSGA